MTQGSQTFERWLRTAPMGRLHAWLTSVPGAMAYNTPVFNLHQELKLHPENRLLDIGAGRGALLHLLCARVAFEHPPVGVELSRGEMAAEHDAWPFEMLQATPGRLPLADESFDVVTCGYATQHLEDAELLSMLRELRRVLTLGGIALLWDFAPTRSATLNAFHDRVLHALGRQPATARTYTTLSAYALEAGFEWVSNAHLRPFLFPPIPRVSLLIGKAPLGWQPPEAPQDLTPDTHARSLVAGVTQETLSPGTDPGPR